MLHTRCALQQPQKMRQHPVQELKLVYGQRLSTPEEAGTKLVTDYAAQAVYPRERPSAVADVNLSGVAASTLGRAIGGSDRDRRHGGVVLSGRARSSFNLLLAKIRYFR